MPPKKIKKKGTFRTSYQETLDRNNARKYGQVQPHNQGKFGSDFVPSAPSTSATTRMPTPNQITQISREEADRLRKEKEQQTKQIELRLEEFRKSEEQKKEKLYALARHLTLQR